MCRLLLNPHRTIPIDSNAGLNDAFNASDIQGFHTSLSDYAPTPLLGLPALAERLGLAAIYVKDESKRFGLKAFKILGASYGIYRFLRHQDVFAPYASLGPEDFLHLIRGDFGDRFTFCTATDGNHGRAVAWMARKLKQRSVIYVPCHTVQERIDAIRSEDAEVIIVDGSYDDAVEHCKRDAADNDWPIVADASWPGYEQIPHWIMAGYRTLLHEIHESQQHVDCNPDLVMIQSGVGALAAAVAWYYNCKYDGQCPKLVTVEPNSAACLQEAITPLQVRDAGDKANHRGQTIMAGLNCPTLSHAAWPILRSGIDGFLSISDDYARRAMRLFFRSGNGDPAIVSGESGAAGLAGLIAILEQDGFAREREQLRTGSGTRVLILNTEGDTDPDEWKSIVGLA